MNKIIIAFLLFSCSLVHAQKFTHYIDGIQLKCVFEINEQVINESFLLKNTTNKSIYVPSLSDTSLYYFLLNKKSYSYIGVKSSMLGPANLGGRVLLNEVKAGDSLAINIVVPNKQEGIETYLISVDFIKEEDIKRKKVELKENSLVMEMQDYMEWGKYYYFTYNPFGN